MAGEPITLKEYFTVNTIFSRSIVYGFVLGTVLFVIAPLGLGIAFIELLKPLLVPGVLVTQLLLDSNGGMVPVVLALIFNGIIFSLLFFAYYSIRRDASE